MTKARLPETDRRNALKKVLAGAGVAGGAALTSESWIRPVISTATIPAHAISTLVECDFDVSLNVAESFEAAMELDFSPPQDVMNAEFTVEVFSEAGISNVGGSTSGFVENGVITEFGGDLSIVFESGGSPNTELDVLIDFTESDDQVRRSCSFSTVVNLE